MSARALLVGCVQAPACVLHGDCQDVNFKNQRPCLYFSDGSELLTGIMAREGSHRGP